MSGHSKWATTHRQKEAADAKRGVLFTRLGKNIAVIAKQGGGDPETNFRLRLAIEKARAANMTKDNIEKAILRGTGQGSGGQIESVLYEGFGPAGVAVMIDCSTDNRNRTSADLKHLMTEFGGTFGAPNSVAWLFEQKGVVRISHLNDETELALIDLGAQDIIRQIEGVTIYTALADLKKITDYLATKHLELVSAGIEWVPKEKKVLTDGQKASLEQFLEALEGFEDLNDYYTNAED